MQKKKLVCLLSLVVNFCLSETGQAAIKKQTNKAEARSFETSGLANPGVAPARTKQTPKKKEFQKHNGAPVGMLELDQAEIVSTLKSLNTLISKSRNQRELHTLHLNRAMASFSLARKRLLESKTLKMDKLGLRLLNASQQDCQKVLAFKRASPEMRARAHYIYGLNLVYLDKTAAATQAFQNSLRIDPASENAAWMGLHIAESFFDQSEFKKAAAYYQKYLKKLTPQAYDLARYKLAWCMVNQGAIDEAKRLLISLVYSSSENGYVKDSLRDLAFVLSKRVSEAEILGITNKELKRDEHRVEFLAAVMNQLEAQNAVKLQSKVLDRLLELETDPIKKLQYLLAGMRTSRRGYASVEHFNSFVKIRNFMKNEDLSSAESESVKISLEQEAQFLIKSFIETFSGKVKTPERLPKAKIGQGLVSLFAFYEQYFLRSKVMPEIIILWENVCFEIADWTCVDEVSEKILQNPKLKNQHQRVAIDQLLAFDQLQSTSKKSLEDRVEAKFKAFLEEYPQSDQWESIAEKLAGLYIRRNEPEKGLSVLNLIFEHERTGATLYNLMRQRFDLKQYAAILKDSRVPSRRPDSRVMDVKRESALRLAIEAKNRGNEADYRNYLNEFLRLNPSAEKMVLVQKELLDFLLKKNEIGLALQELLKIPPQKRCEKSFRKSCLATWREMMKTGRLEESRALFRGMLKKTAQPFAFQILLSDLALQRKVEARNFSSLDLSSQEYVLGLLSLFEPEQALGLLKSKSLKLNSKKSFPYKLIALRLKNGEWDLSRNRENEVVLGKKYNFVSRKGSTQLKSDVLLKAIIVPKGKISEKRLGKTSAQIGQAILKMRSRLQKDLAAKIPLEDKERVLLKAIQVEAEVAAFINRQDVPRAVPEEQVSQYQEKVAALARGYEQQSMEWEKVLIEIRRAIEKRESEQSSQALVLSSASQYPFGEVFEAEKLGFLKEFIEGNRGLAALIVWDLLRADLKQTDEQYLRVRTGILFSANSSSIMRRYLYQELKQTSQNVLLNELQGKARKKTAKMTERDRTQKEPAKQKEAAAIAGEDEMDALLEGDL